MGSNDLMRENEIVLSPFPLISRQSEQVREHVEVRDRKHSPISTLPRRLEETREHAKVRETAEEENSVIQAAKARNVAVRDLRIIATKGVRPRDDGGKGTSRPNGGT